MEPPHPTVSLISCANANSRYQSDNIKRRCLWKCCLNTYLKNFATIPCCHAVITYVSLGACTYWLTPIFCSAGRFLHMNLFPVFHSSKRIIEWFFGNSKVNFFSEVRLKWSFPSQVNYIWRYFPSKGQYFLFCSCSHLYFPCFDGECSCYDSLWLTWCFACSYNSF